MATRRSARIRSAKAAKDVSYEIKIKENDASIEDLKTEPFDQRNNFDMHENGMDENQAQFGQLYSGQIKMLFEDCTKDQDNIKLSFDGRKIYVEFDRSLGDMDKSMSSYKSDQRRNLFSFSIIGICSSETC